MKKSKFLNIDLKDLFKGALVAMVTIIATSVLTIVESGDLLTLLEWVTLKPIVLAGVGGFIAYLLKNLLTNFLTEKDISYRGVRDLKLRG